MLAALLLLAATGTATLVWDASTTPGCTYNVYWSTNNVAYSFVTNTASLGATDIYKDTDTNWWQVRATKDGAESTPLTGKLDPVIAPPQPPAPPTNLRINRVQGNRYDLSWTSLLAYSTSVERAPPNGAFSELAFLYPGIMHYSADIKPHESWLFRVRACGSGCGPPSEPVLVIR